MIAAVAGLMDTSFLDDIADRTSRRYNHYLAGKQQVDAGGFHRFHRGGLACAVSRTDPQPYWGHVGVPAESEYHGRLFVPVAGVRLYKVHMPLCGSRSMDRMWWFGFEGSYCYERTMRDLHAAVDALVQNDRTAPSIHTSQ